MKNKIGLTLVTIVSLLQSCSKQEYVNIPKNADGSAYITTVASTTNTGMTTLDDTVRITATLPNAKVGDEMVAELLAQQMPAGGTSTQLLPIAGTQKKLIVGSDYKVAVTYTRAQALFKNVNDQVTVTFAGKTESAFTTISMVAASSVKGPLYGGSAVNIRRNSGDAYFDVTVAPKNKAYTGTFRVLKKNGLALAWSSTDYAYGTKVPISESDFAAGKDTMYYTFVSTVGSYSDTVRSTLIATAPLLQLTKSGTMVLGATTGGVNVMSNATVKATDTLAILAIDAASLQIKAGSALRSTTTISFVQSTSALYAEGNAVNIKAAFDAGTALSTIDPIAGVPVNIFKIVDASGTYYGILSITSVVPGTSVAYAYKIGSTYAQLAILK